ncbi:hypothetical protein ACUXHY_005407 [Cytobacillus horneckiae]|uniref:hypothetical protein n=1 Tax=Cytobacillus horneckiae TaxID=549687 RepID=UPI0019D10840|nr:hypothetical protein [Cytobacillus horneckiae]MCM3181141.1 hypothetical protein [Cytobacillus horneckiae]
MNFKKTLISTVAGVALIGSISPTISFASTEKVETINVTQEQVNEVEDLFNVVMEIENSSLDMVTLSNNAKSDIEALSKDAQRLYSLYAEFSNNGEIQLTEEQSFSLLNLYLTNPNSSQSIVSQGIAPASIGSVKEYKLSHQDVVDIGKLVGVHGTGWGFLAAIAKKFAKKPTYATMLIVAVPALGWSVLNACNRYNKGVIIKDIRIGATHNFSCSARK